MEGIFREYDFGVIFLLDGKSRLEEGEGGVGFIWEGFEEFFM